MPGKLWHYPVYLLATIAILMGCYWLFLLTAPRGWGGRSGLQIALFACVYSVLQKIVDLWTGQLAYATRQQR